MKIREKIIDLGLFQKDSTNQLCLYRPRIRNKEVTKRLTLQIVLKTPDDYIQCDYLYLVRSTIVFEIQFRLSNNNISTISFYLKNFSGGSRTFCRICEVWQLQKKSFKLLVFWIKFFFHLGFQVQEVRSSTFDKQNFRFDTQFEVVFLAGVRHNTNQQHCNAICCHSLPSFCEINNYIELYA